MWSLRHTLRHAAFLSPQVDECHVKKVKAVMNLQTSHEAQISSSEVSGGADLKVFICTLESFPTGTAHTNKIGLVARALHAAGVPVSVLMLDAWEDPANAMNREARGFFHGIPFEYTPGRTTAAPGFLRRNLLKLKGLLVALQRIREARYAHKAAMFYIHDGGRLIPLLAVCRLMGVRTIIDLCEWMPAFSDANIFNRWGYSTGLIFRLCDAVIPISRMLQRRVQEVVGKKAPTSFYLSNLIDPVEFEAVPLRPDRPRYILWAGLMDQYRETVRFVLRAFKLVQQTNPDVQLVLCGGASAETKAEILRIAEQELLPGSLILPGFVSRQELLQYYAGALALLIPLEDDERSRARFPFKLGEYLLTGRPVISSRVGDIPEYLEHGKSAMLAVPDSPESFADCVNIILADPDYAQQLGHAGRAVGYARFDYRKVGPSIASFVKEISI